MHMYNVYTSIYVGWKDLALFVILKNGTIAADQVYFQEVNFQKFGQAAKLNIYY